MIYKTLKGQIELRENLGKRYRLELRSKSDAQIAEAVIAQELERLGGRRPVRPTIEPGTSYQYNIPDFIQYQTEEFQAMLERVRVAWFEVAANGAIGLPKELDELSVSLGEGVYRMGIGGLHSSETCQTHLADKNTLLVDKDVVSYYPSIILNQKLFPRHLGRQFLDVYRQIVERRIKAKREKNKVEADSLKITINGSFGKLGSKWSCLYSPDLMVQVTLTGQLALLMLIERLELAGIKVVSANTDGVLIKTERSNRELLDSIVATWERDTAFETEETGYLAACIRDVNNYLAVKEDLKVKTKGIFANPWDGQTEPIWKFHKNPQSVIVNEALTLFLQTGADVSETIRGCRDIRKFLTLRTVKGGGVKDGVFLGKVVRWYYSTTAGGEIVYAKSGNKVPLSDSAVPVRDLPENLPDDVDFSRYERIAYQQLAQIGWSK